MVYYIILDVIPEVLFEDNLNFSENIKLKGVNDIMMIKLQEKEPYLIGRFWFIIFTILSLASLYNIFV